MKIPLLCSLILLNVTLGWSDSLYIAKQRAKNVAEQNNAHQANIQQAARETAPPDSALQATLQNVADLQASFLSLGKVTKAGAEQKVALLNQITAAAQGVKPAAAEVKQLADDLVAALTNNQKLNPSQLKQLAGFVHAACNGAKLSAAQVDQVTAGLQKILTAAEVATPQVDAVIASLKKIIAATK